MTLWGLSGESTDQQDLSRGHFGGKAAGIISLFVYIQDLLNELATLKSELIPVMKKTKAGMIWVSQKTEADQFGQDYGYNIVQKGSWKLDKDEKPIEFIVLSGEENRYYFEYQGFTVRDTGIALFAYNVARATGSFQGETKQKISESLSNLKAVPIFPQQGFQSTWSNPNESEEE